MKYKDLIDILVKGKVIRTLGKQNRYSKEDMRGNLEVTPGELDIHAGFHSNDYSEKVYLRSFSDKEIRAIVECHSWETGICGGISETSEELVWVNPKEKSLKSIKKITYSGKPQYRL